MAASIDITQAMTVVEYKGYRIEVSPVGKGYQHAQPFCTSKASFEPSIARFFMLPLDGSALRIATVAVN